MSRTMLNSGMSARGPRRYSRPTVEVPTVEEPTVEEPPTSEPTVDEPPADEPTVEVPADLTTIKALEEWVGSDPARAQAVIDAENAKPERDRRTTLIKKMGEIDLI